MTRVFKKNVKSCWECPGRDKLTENAKNNASVNHPNLGTDWTEVDI